MTDPNGQPQQQPNDETVAGDEGRQDPALAEGTDSQDQPDTTGSADEQAE
jgi:hypothetical protein